MGELDECFKKFEEYAERQRIRRNEYIAKKIIALGPTVCNDYMSRNADERNKDSVASVALAKAMHSSTEVGEVFFDSMAKINLLVSDKDFNFELKKDLDNILGLYHVAINK